MKISFVRACAVVLVSAGLVTGCTFNQTLSKVPVVSSVIPNPDEYFALKDDTSITDAEYEVVYTDLGFEPATLTVSPNTRVVFLNNSAASVWIRSKQPWFSLQPTFDQAEGMDGGEWLSIIFKQEGEWIFENYLNPKQTGKIVVESSSE